MTLCAVKAFDMTRRSILQEVLDLEPAGDLGELPLELRLVRDALVDLHPEVGLAMLSEEPALDAGRVAYGGKKLPDHELAIAGLLRIDPVVDVKIECHAPMLLARRWHGNRMRARE